MTPTPEMAEQYETFERAGRYRVGGEALAAFVGRLLMAHGVPEADAGITADALVAADLEGLASHGCGLIPLYIARLAAGSVRADARPAIDADLGGLVSMDAGHGLGQVSARAATDLAIARAREHGIGMVAVRHAFHFGAASYWVRRMTAAGMAGMAMANTRPLMPAPGGASRVVGNNPLSIGFPAAEGTPVVTDMAMSATAMGRIRIADARGESIPEGWACDAQGRPTTDPAEAIKGMLLPAAGAKGFGLAVAIDLLCGALSGGSIGGEVRPLYGNDANPYDCSMAFIAIDSGRLAPGAAQRAAALAQDIRNSARAEGAGDIYAPGDRARARRQAGNGRCTLDGQVLNELEKLASDAGAPGLGRDGIERV